MRRTLPAALATSVLLVACTAGGPAPSSTPTPASSTPTLAPPSPPPTPPTTPSPPSVPVVVRGVTANLCAGCVRFGRRSGVGIVALVRNVLEQVTSLLPRMRSRIDVVMRPGTGPPAGVSGYTEWSTGHVRIYLHAAAPDPANGLRVWLPFTLAHELDHAARVLRGPGIDDTLLDWFVAEGMADRFAATVIPSVPPSQADHALTARQTASLWARARPQLRSFQTIVRLRRWFFGTKRIPRYTGYSIGYDIVSGYLERHPGVSVVDLVTIDADRILRGSGFNP